MSSAISEPDLQLAVFLPTGGVSYVIIKHNKMLELLVNSSSAILELLQYHERILIAP